jgi:hypothetical protein
MNKESGKKPSKKARISSNPPKIYHIDALNRFAATLPPVITDIMHKCTSQLINMNKKYMQSSNSLKKFDNVNYIPKSVHSKFQLGAPDGLRQSKEYLEVKATAENLKLEYERKQKDIILANTRLTRDMYLNDCKLFMIFNIYKLTAVFIIHQYNNDEYTQDDVHQNVHDLMVHESGKVTPFYNEFFDSVDSFVATYINKYPDAFTIMSKLNSVTENNITAVEPTLEENSVAVELPRENNSYSVENLVITQSHEADTYSLLTQEFTMDNNDHEIYHIDIPTNDSTELSKRHYSQTNNEMYNENYENYTNYSANHTDSYENSSHSNKTPTLKNPYVKTRHQVAKAASTNEPVEIFYSEVLDLKKRAPKAILPTTQSVESPLSKKKLYKVKKAPPTSTAITSTASQIQVETTTIASSTSTQTYITANNFILSEEDIIELSRIFFAMFITPFSKLREDITDKEAQSKIAKLDKLLNYSELTNKTAAILDSEPTIDPKTMKDLIRGELATENAKIKKELEKMKQQLQRNLNSKNNAKQNNNNKDDGIKNKLNSKNGRRGKKNTRAIQNKSQINSNNNNISSSNSSSSNKKQQQRKRKLEAADANNDITSNSKRRNLASNKKPKKNTPNSSKKSNNKPKNQRRQK